MTMTPKIKINNKKPTENNSDSTNFRAGRTGVRATGAGKCTSMTSLLQVGSRARARKRKSSNTEKRSLFRFRNEIKQNNPTIKRSTERYNGTAQKRAAKSDAAFNLLLS